MVPHGDRIHQLLTDETYRAVVTIVTEADGPITVRELAERLASRRVPPSPVDEESVTRTVVSLHHIHLPKLDEVRLIEYDYDRNVATIGERSSSGVEWKNIEAIDELLSRFEAGNGADENAIRILEGSTDIYEYGRELADTAEDELFLIYASDDLLDEACLPHAKNAIDRGVELYAGTKSKEARIFFREHLSEATVWDPQLDWMNDHSRYPKISRLIFADRKRVVVSLWEKPDSDGAKTEVAMIGEGETNPLVVLARELLGPRLDHLDYQSDDFLSDLPFEA